MDENVDGAMVATVTTENASEVTVEGSGSDYFEVADGSLKLKDGMSLNFEEVEGGTIELTLTASGDGESAEAMVTVTVNDVNEDPSISVRDGESVPDADGSTEGRPVSSLTLAENAMKGDEGVPPLALIEVMDPDAGEVLIGQDAADAVTITGEQADKFQVILDPVDGMWLHLADGASLDYEEDSEVTVTVTFTDQGGLTAEQDVTVTVTDVNEAPMAVGEVGNVPAEAGKALSHEVDLMALFSDPDGGDTIESWTLSGAPDWLELVTRHDDGSVTGILQGTPPTTGADSFGDHEVTITATDSGGETASVSFIVAVDDGNDRPTGINLISEGQSVVEVEVTEGDASGVVLGEIMVEDIDNPQHPYGQHLITLNDDRFEIRTDDDGRKWLALKEGESLDRERERGEVLVTLRAIDRNGEKDEDGDYEGHRSDPVTFAVVINDVNDAPRSGTIGNWWVTVDEDLDAEDVNAGDWLSFSLETADDTFPAFTDQDLNAGDSLTYSISGPSWLQIDEETGEITNVEGRIPTRGVYRVTVTATDEDGQSASKSFNLNVALSDSADYDHDGDPNTADVSALVGRNRDPDVSQTSTPVYREHSGEQRVATFRVTDQDQDIPDHQFALKSVQITAITNADNDDDPNNVTLQDHDGDDTNNDGIADATAGTTDLPATPMRLWTVAKGSSSTAVDDEDNAGYAGAFELSDPIPTGGGWTFHIDTVDTNPSPFVDTTDLLDYDGSTTGLERGVRSLDFTIRMSDGVTTVTNNNEVEVRISEVNEAPTAPANRGSGSIVLNADLQVEQEAANVKWLYIKLEDLWSDDDDNPNQFDDFGASSNVSWIDILHGPAEWGQIKDGRDGQPGTGDDVPWPTGATYTDSSVTPNVTYDVAFIGGTVAAPDDTEPDRRDMVVIVAIDRTERTNQDDEGSFTLTATDSEGATGERTYKARITDENLPIENDAVTISGSVREGGTLTANFNDNRDPDLVGSATPAAVLYTWYRVDVDANGNPDSTTTPAVITRSTSNTYTPGQDDVDHFIGVVVNYYEVDPGTTTPTDLTDDDELVANSIAAVTVATLVGDTTTDPDTPNDPKAAITSRDVSNTPDRGAASITILADGDTLWVPNNALRIRDGDYSTATNPFGTLTVNPAVDADGDPVAGTPVVSFEVSTNGRGGWTAVDEDDVTYNATDTRTELSLDDGDGKYYRAVVSYNADAGSDPATERVVSDPIQVADVRDDGSPVPTPAPTINGSPNPGGTLSVDAGSATVTVQWQTLSGGKWVDISGATGDLRLTQDHAGDQVRAVVSYQSRDPDNPGVTNVVVAAVTGPGTGGAIGGTPSSVRPVKVDDYAIEASVGGTGHGLLNSDIFSPAGHNATITHTIPLTSLFQDPDTPSFLLSFAAGDLVRTVPGGSDATLASATASGDTYVYEQTAANGGGVLIFESDTGKLTYLSDQYQGHDGAGGAANDGAGNVLTLNLTANDPPPSGGANTGGNALVNLRINVAPTDITFRHNWEAGETAYDSATDNNNDADNLAIPNQVDTAATNGEALYRTAYGTTTDLPEISIAENVEHTGEEILAILDVQDENWSGSSTVPGHKFGSHEITVTGDDRFVISKSGGEDARRDADGDGSTWELRVVKGATFDYETDDADGDRSNGVQIVLTFSATDGGGLSTPTPNPASWIYVYGAANLHKPIQLLVTITNDARDDQPRLNPNTETPGLKDDSSDDDNNDRTDGNDRDTDGGGTTPPPPGMSLGLIEDFVENMDQGEQDLLEDYLLTIDDGLDIV